MEYFPKPRRQAGLSAHHLLLAGLFLATLIAAPAILPGRLVAYSLATSQTDLVQVSPSCTGSSFSNTECPQ